MKDKEFLEHFYTAAALIGMLAGRSGTTDSHKEAQYVLKAKRIGRAMVEDKADERR